MAGFPVVMGLDDFANSLTTMRVVWLSGRWGGGKTSLAVELALRLFLSGQVDNIVTNQQLMLDHDDLISAKDVPQMKSAAIIMDEAWQYLQAGDFRRVKDWLAFPRMFNQIWLLPSVLNLTGQVRQLKVARIYNGMPVGVPVWVYAAWDGTQTSSKVHREYFYWVRPQTVFGIYDTKSPPGDSFWVYSRYGGQNERESTLDFESVKT